MRWHSTALGISWNAAKVQLARALAKMLGEFIGRRALVPNSLKQLREFLGRSNYVRPCCRPSSARHLHVLKPWLKGEEFPLSEETSKSIEALMEDAEEQVALSSLNEEAAVRAFHPDEKQRLRFGPFGLESPWQTVLSMPSEEGCYR